MTGRFVLRWLAAFVFTQAIEIPIYRHTLHRGFWTSFGASALTHPLLWLFLASHLWAPPWPIQIAAVELFAWAAEAAYFRMGFGCRQALQWSFVANATSFTLGLASRALIGCP